jgi:hypothetical protein
MSSRLFATIWARAPINGEARADLRLFLLLL